MSEIKPSFWLAKVDHVSLMDEEGAGECLMMKPFIWINKTVHAEFDGAKGDLGMTVSVWNDNLNQYAKSNGLKPMDVPLYTSEQLAEAVAAEREKGDAIIRSLAVGYERMSRVLCKMAATSGPDTSWYRHQADQGIGSVPAIWDITQNPVEAQPGECSWINREGSLDAIRSAAK